MREITTCDGDFSGSILRRLVSITDAVMVVEVELATVAVAVGVNRGSFDIDNKRVVSVIRLAFYQH